MKAKQKAESRKQESESERGRVLVNSHGLAVALGVSLRTVQRMLAAEEIVPVRLRGTVRFYVPDVVQCLRDQSRKWGRAADAEKLKAETLTNEVGRSEGAKVRRTEN